MKRALAFAFFFSLFSCWFHAYSQTEIRTGDTIRCPLYEHHVEQVSQILRSQESNQRTQEIENIFDVSYSGFSDEARAVFERATEIWSTHLKSKIKIKVLAQWAVSSSTSNLGFVVPTEIRNFPGAPKKNVWYPMTLAEKLAGIPLNGSGEIDIIANFNSGRDDWYFGLDGNPGGDFDLLTIILHELGHGLGISATFTKSGVNGSFGISGDPKIYDLFLANGLGQYLTDDDQFSNGSAALGTQLTSNSLVFESPIATSLNSPNGKARIYCPNPFNPGSSISHLDQQTYNNTANGLMTPFAQPGKVVHAPGPLIKGMLYEMGWLHTFINHEPLHDQESLSGIPFDFAVESDTTVFANTATLHISFDDFESEDAITMSENTPGVFSTTLANAPAETTVSYYFTIEDVFEREYRYPIDPDEDVSFFHGVDVIAPVITHTPPGDIIEFTSIVSFVATVTDNIGLAEVDLQYQVNDGDVVSVPMMAGPHGSYSYDLDVSSLDLHQGDEVRYRIVATDISSQANQQFFPADGLQAISVLEFSPQSVYVDNFNSANQNYFGDFEVKTITGFSNGAIHSPHPYPKSDQPGQVVDLTYTLLYPIEIKPDESFVEFQEVVLIEPGTGSDHTDPAFKDYVIVEGSSDSGETWQPLLPGYDSRANSQWLEYFNKNTKQGDSESVGTLNYFHNRKIDLLETFNPSDIVYIRFRLRSDDAGNGWGWAIDDLQIQSQVVGIADVEVSRATVPTASPNPAESTIKLKWGEGLSVNDVPYRIVDSTGRVVSTGATENGSIRIADLPPGVYFVRVAHQSRVVTVRFVKI